MGPGPNTCAIDGLFSSSPFPLALCFHFLRYRETAVSQLIWGIQSAAASFSQHWIGQQLTASVCREEISSDNRRNRMLDNEDHRLENHPRELTQNPLKKIWMPHKNGHIAHRRGKRCGKCANTGCDWDRHCFSVALTFSFMFISLKKTRF